MYGQNRLRSGDFAMKDRVQDCSFHKIKKDKQGTKKKKEPITPVIKACDSHFVLLFPENKTYYCHHNVLLAVQLCRLYPRALHLYI